MKKSFKENLLCALLSCSMISTIINIFTIGVIPQVLNFPTANFLVIMFMWMYRAFDHIPSLVLGCLVLTLLIACTVIYFLFRKKAILYVLIGIYAIDFLIMVLLCVRSMLWTMPLALLFTISLLCIAIWNIKKTDAGSVGSTGEE